MDSRRFAAIVKISERTLSNKLKGSVSYKMDFNKASFSPGIEAYFRPNDNSYQVGPVLYGEIRTDKGNELEYSLGVVHGINPGAPAKTLLARLEYEFF